MTYIHDFLAKNNAHTHLPADCSYAISLFYNPNKRIEFDLNQPVTKQVVEDLTSMTTESFGSVLDESSADGTLYHMQNVDVLAIAHTAEQFLGFASGFLHDNELFYLHGVAVRDNSKHKGVAKRLIYAMLRQSGYGSLACTTQNPVIYCLLQSMFRYVSPSLDFTAVHPDIQEKTKALMAHRPGTFLEASGKAIDLYGQCLYKTIPESADRLVNAAFERWLDTMVTGQSRHGMCLVGEVLRH